MAQRIQNNFSYNRVDQINVVHDYEKLSLRLQNFINGIFWEVKCLRNC